MADQGNEKVQNNGAANNPENPPSSNAFEQAKNLVSTMSTSDLQSLRDHIQAEIDRRSRELSRQREEEEQRRQMQEEKYECKFDRKEEEWEEKHSECKRYGSATYEDSEASGDDMEYGVEEANTSDLDLDATTDKARMNEYHDRRLRSRFDFELANPKIYARTMRERESSIDSEETLEDESDEDQDGSDADDVESTPSSDNTSPASSESADEWF
ncbi:outer spore wall assembly protein SHE10-like [Papaver somniferum]|uniref:outer spore wall assembly protein SHE10-like n=1 Tax=Papaver somniferum TaxID=3469 RepID=UPI000E6FCE7D|nr:outer spore wall assembly protein SHE10-like [Papaver somniferum]